VKTSAIPSIENTCAVIVTYHPDDDVISRLRLIQNQLPSLIIIDNASSKKCQSVLDDFSAPPKVRLVKNYENEGIGKALNQAATLAIESGFSWILTLDQDTVVQEDMFNELASVYKYSGYSSPFIGSNYWNALRNKQLIECTSQSDHAFIEQRTIITSGTLMKLELFESVGHFREDYFIDSVDHEYCLRIRASGFSVLMSCKSLMSHSIGQSGSLTSRFQAFEHPPIRKYYIARNTLVTLKDYFTREPAWSMRQLLRLAVELTSIIFFEGDKKNKSYAFIRGIIDGIRNKMGRCEWI